MRLKPYKVLVYCHDDALLNYLQRVLKRDEEIEVVFPPPPPLNLWQRRLWWKGISHRWR